MKPYIINKQVTRKNCSSLIACFSVQVLVLDIFKDGLNKHIPRENFDLFLKSSTVHSPGASRLLNKRLTSDHNIQKHVMLCLVQLFRTKRFSRVYLLEVSLPSIFP